MSTSDEDLLRLVVVSGSPAADEVVGVLDSWRSWGVLEPLWVCQAAGVPGLAGPAQAIPARELGAAGSAEVDLLKMAARWGSMRSIKGVFLHDCEVSEGVGDYVDRCAAIRHALRRALPSEVSSQTLDEYIELGMVNLFAPVDSTAVFSPDTVGRVGAPGAVLATEDRAAPSAMAAPISRTDNYAAHVAGAVATLSGAWRGLPMHDVREIFLRAIDHENSYQVRAMRQMIRIAGVDPSIGRVADEVAIAMRGGARPDLVNTGTVSRGGLMDSRLVDGAVDAVRRLDGDPVAFRSPRELKKEVVIHGAADLRRHKWAFMLGQTRETFRMALLAVKNWGREKEREIMLGDNPHRELAHHDLPGRRLQQLVRESASYTSEMDRLDRGLGYEGMPGELMSALRIRSFELVDGGLDEVSEVSAQPVLSDRGKAVPHPNERIRLDVDVADALREKDSEPAFMDMWRLGGLLHLIAQFHSVERAEQETVDAFPDTSATQVPPPVPSDKSRHDEGAVSEADEDLDDLDENVDFDAAGPEALDEEAAVGQDEPTGTEDDDEQGERP